LFSRSVTVILNHSSGDEKDSTLPDQIVNILGQHGIQADLHIVRAGDIITDIAKSALRRGSKVVVAGGGDGTISAVAAALVDSDAALGVLPLGTLNHFAKDLGLPIDIEKALEVIDQGTVRKVDVGEVNSKIFLNNSSLGLYPMFVRGRIQKLRLGRNKWTALLWSLLATLRHYPVLTVAFSTDDSRFVRRTPLVFVGNNQYQINGFEIGSRARIDGGKLAVYVTSKDGPAALVEMGVAAIFGLLRRSVDFDYVSTETLRIDAPSKGIQVANDGEVSTFTLPLKYRTRPLALNVIVPADI